MILGVDVGSTTCKYALVDGDRVVAKAYERHNTKQAEKVLEFLVNLERDHGLSPGRDRVFFTGSGAGLLAPHAGAKAYQEVVAVAAAVEKLHPDVRFVSEIGGEDMKTIFFTVEGEARNKQVLMQSACSGGTGTFVEKTARKLGVRTEALAEMGYGGRTLHKLSSKCGIFAEADANSLVKAGIPNEEIIASLFEAVVYQNLSTLTKGNTPMPQVLLLGGPNLFFRGLREAWAVHLGRLWKERGVELPAGKSPEDLIVVPGDAVYYAALGCVELGGAEQAGTGVYAGVEKLRWWIEVGQHEEKKKAGRAALWEEQEELERFRAEFVKPPPQCVPLRGDTVVIGCDFGSTTAKAVCITPDREFVHSCYSLSRGNPIEDAKALFRQVREGIGDAKIVGLGLTGYGKDLLKDILGADCAVVETIAHASAGLHFFPDADCICDVGGVDVKIMILAQGTVVDFRLNSQCSSGNGAFLQGVAERFAIPLGEMADRAFSAQAMPQLSMGCGVFLQSDIVNQQRKGWQADEILAGLCGILPLNVWIYAGGLNNLHTIGRKFILQGGTHRNLAVVKAQVDFIRSKMPHSEVVVHPWSGEAGAIGAGLVALEWWKAGGRSRFRGYETIESLTYRTTTSPKTVCKWCPVDCQRSFIDVEFPGAEGRSWSKVPLQPGWQRVIVNNSCPKGLVEDVDEMKLVKAEMETTKAAYPNVADLVRKEAFRTVHAAAR
ncbi:MAG: activase [Planctomycetia bacterium]|nr:activase [Planctomycetia bacterium]